jgi:hypothetical protein
MKTVFPGVLNSDPDWIQIKGGQKVPKIGQKYEIHEPLLEGWRLCSLCWEPERLFPL